MSMTLPSVFIEAIISKLDSEATLLFSHEEKIQSDLMRWKKILVEINSVLDDTEKQTTDPTVKTWLDELQNLAYDVEDLLDEFETEAFRRKLLHQEPASDQPSASKFRKLISTCCTKFTTRSVNFDSMMMSKIKEVTARLQDIATQKDRLVLKDNLDGKSTNVGQRFPSTSLVNESKVYGRDKEKHEILDLLFRDDLRADDPFSVISIVGMGGVGKTTLAQLVYNDPLVKVHFDLRVWICVSEDFDVFRVTKSIIKSISTDERVDYDDLNKLQEKLEQLLWERRFLIVLDDVWTENYNHWTTLSCPFEHGAPGSRILVTTRNQGVAVTMDSLQAYCLRELTKDDGLRVFAQHCFGAKYFSMHQSLKDFGEKIVNKCNGLPLAAKALGGLLRGKDDLNDWEFVLNTDIWELSEESCDILPALRVSYHYLPPKLKRCFAYCSLFPKHYEFHEEELILLWMADGLLDHKDIKEQMHNLGHKYFHELHSRSFFQQSSSDTSLFVMHDLINDLAQWAAKGIFFRVEDALEGSMQQRFLKNLRHLSYIQGEYDGIKKFEAAFDAEHLRTFLPISFSKTFGSHYLARSVLYWLLRLPRLRFFSLRRYCIFDLPNSIGDMKHLRHLDLSETQIQILPESVNALYNLHTLMLQECYRLKKMCSNMGNLLKLHHLNNSHVDSLEEMPKGIGKLTCLLTLCSFVVGKDVGSGLQELKLLLHLQGALKISKLENVRDAGDAKAAQLNEKKNLKMLLLEWTSTDRLMEPEIEKHVLDMLVPHLNLEQFCISGYGGTTFPIWFEDFSLSNLVSLKFQNCGMCTSLPPVGQLPSLKHLEVLGMSSIKSVGLEFYGKNCPIAFPSLERLCFEDMKEWEIWIPNRFGQHVEVFPCLRELSVRDCSKLRGRLPECLPSLEQLVIKRCEQLVASIPSLPTLCRLEIDGCKKVVGRSKTDLVSLNSVVGQNLSNQVFLEWPLGQSSPKLEELKINNIGELTSLWHNETRLLKDNRSLKRLKIESCPELQSLVAKEEEDQQHHWLSFGLECLEMGNCERLVKLPQALFSLYFLREIKIWCCSSLVSLPEAWMHNTNSCIELLNIVRCPSLTCIARVQLPPSLKQLAINACDNLRTLIEEEHIYMSSSKRYPSLLKNLVIRWCPSLTSLFSKSELPPTLEHLDVRYCSKLAYLSWSGNLPLALKHLDVYECSKLESIAERLAMNTSLQKIRICYCENLKLLPDGLHELSHIQEICIIECPNLLSFPEGGLPFRTLTKLEIAGCENLEALPNGMHNLTSLQVLKIKDIPRVISFPEYGFPTNLHSLEIHDMKIWKSLIKWGLNTLRRLTISGCKDVVSLSPDEIGTMLPASLIQLEIQNFQNLEYLSSFGENLTSLEYLGLSDCPKLKYFPKKGLSPSVLKLYINDCPLIEERCRKDRGLYWPLIAEIPCVKINWMWVFDDSTED